MFTLFLTIEPDVESIRPRSQVVRCPRLIERLNAGLHHAQTRAPPCTVPPLKPRLCQPLARAPNLSSHTRSKVLVLSIRVE